MFQLDLPDAILAKMKAEAISLNTFLDVFYYGHDVMDFTRVKKDIPVEIGFTYSYEPEYKKYTIMSLWKRQSFQPSPLSPLCPICSQTFPTLRGRKIHTSRLHKQREIASEFP